jgi:hypothetical protein
VLAEVDPSGDWIPNRAILEPHKLDAGVLVGEVIHNLRVALDYLVYVLAARELDRRSPELSSA